MNTTLEEIISLYNYDGYIWIESGDLHSDNNTRHSTLRKIIDGLFAIASPQGQWWWWWWCHCNCRWIVFCSMLFEIWLACWIETSLQDYESWWTKESKGGGLRNGGFGVRVTESREEKERNATQRQIKARSQTNIYCKVFCSGRGRRRL